MNQSQNLPEYMLHFFRYLRDLKLLIGMKEMADVYSALDAIDIMDREQFKLALKIVLVSSKEEEEIFEQAFYQFFVRDLREEHKQDLLHFHSDDRMDQVLVNNERIGENPKQKQNKAASDDEYPLKLEGEEEAKSDETPGIVTDILPIDDEAGVNGTIPLWSATKGLNKQGQQIEAKITAKQFSKMEKTAKKLLRQVNIKQSRRSAVKRKGNVLHLQKTLRKSIQTGTEPFELVMKGSRKQKANYVLLCDTSRSMSATVDTFLQFAFALKKLHQHVEVFLFSTKLTRVTDQLSAVNVLPQTLQIRHEEWGGGTCIGESLHDFVEKYAVKVLKKHTVMIIASDGLDAGEIKHLQWSMNEIAIRSEAIIWVNPLLAIEGYAPTARAMNISLPYINHFLSLEDFQCFNKII
ncbi:vWA domain-containing protein [Oceanobacillus chungangensis]|uniref:VWA domain-containing protein n=1 Tax=Oceanobacillus chungangensis TaxID=1229152 RepID=A0A3D8PH26_9BACI|nr:VWA domain-containing protein [Oceanobacillus chungangensis]RDW15386.1 hypothetical protein CWR45_16495 [Oceanobacillus chungangensis]